jgi:hypothetical protein
LRSAALLESTRGRRACIAASFCLAFGVYASNLNDYFLADDFDLVVSFYGEPPSYFFELLYHNESGVVWKDLGIDPDLGRGYLRPFKMWLMKLDLMLWGAHPLGFHVTSNTIFALDVVLVFLILDLLLPGQRIFALLGAGVAAIHPIFSEIVPFIATRESTLATLCVLASFYAALRYRERGGSAWLFHGFYALGLLTKESTIVAVTLALGWDLTRGHLWPLTRQKRRDALRLYGPLLPILAVYMTLRYVAFGNFVGGVGDAGRYLSLEKFVDFHRLFAGSMFEAELFAFPGLSFAPLAAGALLAAALLLLWRLGASRQRWLELLFFGPLFYLGSISVFYGTYFVNRHHTLPVVGLVLFGTLLLASLARGLPPRRQQVLACAAAIVSLIVWLPPTVTMIRRYEHASYVVGTIRAEIDAATAHLPDGSSVLLTSVPQFTVAPWYFGWGLRSALMRPFTESDLANRSLVINARNLELTKTPLSRPDRYDLHLDFADLAGSEPRR